MSNQHERTHQTFDQQSFKEINLKLQSINDVNNLLTVNLHNLPIPAVIVAEAQKR